MELSGKSAQESEKVKKQFGGILSISSILNPTADIEASHDQPWIFFGSQVGPKLAKEHNVDDPWWSMTLWISHASSSKEQILVLADLQRYDMIWYYYLHHFAGFTVSHLLVHQVGTSALRSQAAEGERSAHVAKALVEVVPDDVGCSKYICL